MKKFMALALVAMMVLCSMVVFADETVVTDETVETEETVEAIAEDAEVEAIAEEAVEEATEETVEEVVEEVVETEETTEEVVEDASEAIDSTIIMIQINNKTMFKNDEQIELDVPAQLINDRTMVPMRAIFEALDAVVTWDDATETAIGEKNGVVIKITINSNTMYVGEEAIEIDVPAQLVEDRTLVPVRAISESFGCVVTWDDATETAIIKMDAPVVEEVTEEVTEEATEEVTEEAVEEVTEEVVEETTEEVTEEVVEETTEETPVEEEVAE